jgi:Mrp family chromosome partitioning ATPase
MAFPYLYQEIDHIYAKTLGKGMRTLAVTSSVPGEGTSSVVCALAQRAMAVNYNVLIVDLNLHNPFVSRMIDNNVAIEPKDADTTLDSSGVIVSDTSPSGPDKKIQRPADWNNAIAFEAQKVMIQGGPGIPVIPIPHDDNNQVRFREHSMLKRMINQWLEEYDSIIFDTSPLNLVNQKNIPAQHVATCCDGVIMVVKSGDTQLHQLSDAVATLNTVEVNLVGTVVNDFANPLLGVELIRQSNKLQQRLPWLSNWLVKKIKKSAFLFAEF